MKPDYQKVAFSVSIISIVVNVLLSIVKGVVGLLAHSTALMSDAVHSLSDVFSTIIVIIGIKVASKKPDREHPYGHERFECVAAILLAVLLLLAGLGIATSSFKHLMSQEAFLIPTPLALFGAILSILTKEAMYWYTRFHAKKINSDLLMADAWHHRSDALSSIGALIGIIGAMMGYPLFDLLASFVIVAFIFKATYDIFKDAVDKMVDHSCDDKTEQDIYDFVSQNKDIHRINLLQTRLFGNKIYVDLEIEIDGSLSLSRAHEIAENVHATIEAQFTQVKHVMVHVNPSSPSK